MSLSLRCGKRKTNKKCEEMKAIFHIVIVLSDITKGEKADSLDLESNGNPENPKTSENLVGDPGNSENPMGIQGIQRTRSGSRESRGHKANPKNIFGLYRIKIDEFNKIHIIRYRYYKSNDGLVLIKIFYSYQSVLVSFEIFSNRLLSLVI